MNNPQVDRDRPDLQRLENIVKHHKTIGTAALSLESGIVPERVVELFTNYFSSVRERVNSAGIGDAWVYTPTMADRAAEQESKEQENQLDRQKHQCRVRPF